jgi:hypothetical protein
MSFSALVTVEIACVLPRKSSHREYFVAENEARTSFASRREGHIIAQAAWLGNQLVMRNPTPIPGDDVEINQDITA